MAASWQKWSTRLQSALLGTPDTRISLRLRLLPVWLLGLLLAALLLPDRIWTTLLAGLAGLTAIALLWAREMARGLSAWRGLRYGWVAVGDRLEEAFELRNRSGLPALWVEIYDESTVPGYAIGAARSVGPGDYIRWRQGAVCTRRGQYHLGPWELRTGDPFGLFRVVRRYEAREEIIIHPPIHSTLPLPLPPGQSEGRAHATRAWQATANAATVREYHPHDPYHWIHWPTTARRDALYVRQFDRDVAGDLWLLLDARAAVQLGREDEGTEEHAVLLAASLATRALGEMRGVGLVAYGRNPCIVPPGLGKGQQWKLLRALALLKAEGVVDLIRSLRELGDIARRGSAVLIITPAADAEWLPQLAHLARRGVEGHVVLLDRPSFGGEGASEPLRHAISLLGFRCRVVRRGEVGRPLVETERHGFWDFKVTGTGKAVVVRGPTDR